MPRTIRFQLNGKSVSVRADPQVPLLFVLRGDLELHAPHFGCGLGQCGACTVHLDDAPVRSCVTALESVAGKRVVTLEGLGTPARPHALQQAFIDEQAVQCGYCTNGMIMEAKALLDRNPRPNEQQIREALADNLCRCGTHQRIVRAVQRASQSMK